MNLPIDIGQFLQTKQEQHHQLLDEESELANKLGIKEIEIDLKMSQKQYSFILENTPVYFPHQPYEVQKIYMENVIKALNKQQNALLESPTGTGKTLSLLCASLGWLNKNRKDQMSSQQPKKIKIIYSSRTHTQLKQVAMELKKTVYKPNISMLGSRDQYCIKDDFKMFKGSLLNLNCRKSIKAGECEFYKKDLLLQMSQNYSTQINSLEEAKQFGYKNKVCPFYFDRHRLDIADLILLPYNYLLEKEFQKIVQIENCILIFDEAHSIQQKAEEGCSFSITFNHIVEAENDLERWIDELESRSLFYDQLKARLNQVKMSSELKEFKSIMITIRMFAIYLELIKIKQQFIISETEEKYLIFDARQIQFMIFQNTQDKENTFKLWSENSQTNYAKGLNKINFPRYLLHCSILIEVMSELSQFPGFYFDAWVKFMRNIFELIKVENEREKLNLSLDSLSNIFNQYKLAFILDQNKNLTINMWCLDPSLAFQRLCNQEIYSIILTSGTLQPMPNWASEIGQPFDIQLINQHIIDTNNNLRIFQHKSFDFCFNQRNNEEQIEKFGHILLRLCQNIPNGVLVIFSSYGLMNKFRNTWRNNELIPRLNKIKACFWEPQQNVEMQDVFEIYKQKVKNGAIMFAVHKGKVAEGIDFIDELCRAIFLVGIPYPPFKDNRVIEKMRYLDKIFNDSEVKNEQRIRSSEWYNYQAIRATNQAMGRLIRHKNDFGIIYLCDKRFEQDNIKYGLSQWAQPIIQSWVSNDDVIAKTKEFFQNLILLKEKAIKDLIIQTPYQKQEVKKRKIQFSGLQNFDDFEKLRDETIDKIQKLHEQSTQIQQISPKTQEQKLKITDYFTDKQQKDKTNQKNSNIIKLESTTIQKKIQKTNQDDNLVEEKEENQKRLCLKLKNKK